MLAMDLKYLYNNARVHTGTLTVRNPTAWVLMADMLGCKAQSGKKSSSGPFHRAGQKQQAPSLDFLI